MCAAFGALLYRLGDNLNTVHLEGLPRKVERIPAKNGFLSSYGRKRIPDTWGTTIPYRRFDVDDDRYFSAYVENELIRRPEMPTMSGVLLNRFRQSVFEVFNNAVVHSRTRLGIFSCGQHYPKRHRLDFAVADLGIGIRQNVEDSLGLDLTAPRAILWATEGANTTRRGPIPGGLGLKLLKEFVIRNGGCLQITSDAGSLRLDRGGASIVDLAAPFPGTVVNLEIDTSDAGYYASSSALSSGDIF